MNYPEKPYEGQSPFIFFGFCHEDAALVYPIIDSLQSKGFRIWYDDPRQQEQNRLKVINDHIRSAAVCIAAISIRFARTHSSIQGITLMVTENKPLLPIILDKEKYPKALCLQLAKYSCLPWSDPSNMEKFYHKLLSDSLYDKCRENGIRKPPIEKPTEERKAPPKADLPPITIIENPGNGKDEATEIIRPKMPIAHIIRTRTGELYDLYNIETTLGRSKKYAEIAFHEKSEAISRHHADILFQEGQFFLKDCGSSNKTYINYTETKKGREELEANVAHPLKDIALFSLAEEEFLFIAARVKHFAEAKKRGCACFLVAERTEEWKLLTDEGLFLDRSHCWKDNVLGSKYIHRENEARLIFHDGCHRLINIDSANGISVDGNELPKGKDVILKDSSRIQFKEESIVYKEILINRKASK